MKQVSNLSNRAISAIVLLVMTLTYSVYLVSAQTSGLPAPSLPALNSSAATALFASLTGCGTATYTFVPASGTCVAPASMVYPSGSGIPIVASGTSWGTTVTAPSGTIVGTSDTQTLTNKTLDGVTSTTMGYLDATSSIQTQLNAKVGTGANSTLTSVTGLTTPVYEAASSETVTFSATPTFSNAVRYSTITLTANITSFTLSAPSAVGLEKTLTFCQNGTGSFTVTPPSNVHGFMAVGATASKCNSQHFNYDTAQSAWLSDGPGVINE
jgi:hypothetical protein